MALTATHQLTVDSLGPVPLTVTEQGVGAPVLVLHGGAGPQSVVEFADLLSQAAKVRVLTPVHPGFGGTPRPEALNSISRLAALYLALLDELDLTDVTVVGNSVGGWIAAEMALLKSARMARMVLLDGTGIQVPGHPVADLSGKTLPEILQLSYHNAAPFLINPATLEPAVQQIAAGNMAALSVYNNHQSIDRPLLGRLAEVAMATAVLWGESDHVVDVDYGRAYAAAIPDASFHVLTRAGHTPQVETPDQVITVITTFLTTSAAWKHDYTENTIVPPEHIWAALRDLYSGVKLNDAGDDIVLHGPFAVGTRLSVTPHGAEFVVDCVITELVDSERYAYRSNFNGLYLTSRHTLTRLAGGTRITHHSQIAGPRAETAGLQIGPRITEDRTETMHDLITAAAAKG